VLAGQVAGRESDAQITVFDSVGFALEDYSALRYLLAQSVKHNRGIDIELVPAADDPKDLFRYTRRGASKAVLRKVA
jgi:ornithine cyclodeaminase